MIAENQPSEYHQQKDTACHVWPVLLQLETLLFFDYSVHIVIP